MKADTKSRLWLGPSHDFATSEQLRKDFSSYEGRWPRILSIVSTGRRIGGVWDQRARRRPESWIRVAAGVDLQTMCCIYFPTDSQQGEREENP